MPGMLYKSSQYKVNGGERERGREGVKERVGEQQDPSSHPLYPVLTYSNVLNVQFCRLLVFGSIEAVQLGSTWLLNNISVSVALNLLRDKCKSLLYKKYICFIHNINDISMMFGYFT